MTVTYPLQWPDGWPRTPSHKRAATKFHSTQRKYNPDGKGDGWLDKTVLTIAAARRRATDELERLGARYVTVSTNVRSDNGDGSRADDPGAAIYFQIGDKPMVLACDRWNSVAGNLAAIAGHIIAMRAQERYGVGSTDRAFAGYEALPPPRSSQVERPWRIVLDVTAAIDTLSDADVLAVAESRYKTRVKAAHPDAGGTHDDIVELNRAIASAREELKG